MITTNEEFLDSRRKMKKRVFLSGEEIENPVDHPMLRPSANAVAMTYELALDPAHAELMTAQSNLTGERISRITHPHQGT